MKLMFANVNSICKAEACVGSQWPEFWASIIAMAVDCKPESDGEFEKRLDAFIVQHLETDGTVEYKHFRSVTRYAKRLSEEEIAEN